MNALLVFSAVALEARADRLRFPLVLAATESPARFLVKTVEDNARYRFEKCNLWFGTEVGPLNVSIFDAVNLPETRCHPIDGAWRSMTDEASNDLLTREVNARLAAAIPGIKLWQVLGIGTSLFMVSIIPYDWARVGPFLRSFVGTIGVFSLLRDLPEYGRYQKLEFDESVGRHLTSLAPSSDELRLTSARTLRLLGRILRESLRRVPPPALDPKP